MTIKKARPIIEMTMNEFDVIETFMGFVEDEELDNDEVMDILQELWDYSLNIRKEKRYSSSFFELEIIG